MLNALVFSSLPFLQVMGHGHTRVLTLTHRAQVQRFTADLLHILKCKGSSLPFSQLPSTFLDVHQRPLEVADYGVCSLDDLLADIPSTLLTVSTTVSEGGTASSS